MPASSADDDPSSDDSNSSTDSGSPSAGYGRSFTDHGSLSTDYDSPWKEALEYYFTDFLALLAPWLHKQIDWRHPPVFLDKELQAVARHARAGRRYADKLVRLRHKSQRPLWLLVHVEVQGGTATAVRLTRYAQRMFQYYYRITDHQAAAWTDAAGRTHTAQVLSLGVLTASAGPVGAGVGRDGSTKVGTDATAHLVYVHDGPGGFHVQFRFPVIHLASWLARWQELERRAARNPFAVVVMAQLRAQQTTLPGRSLGRDSQPDDPLRGRERLASKTQIMCLLYRYGYSQHQFLQVYRLIDWILTLPPTLEPAFQRALNLLDKEHNVAFVTSIERMAQKKWEHIGMQKGEHIGMQKGERAGRTALLERLFIRKFGALPSPMQKRLQSATLEQLETWSLNILDATQPDEVFTD